VPPAGVGAVPPPLPNSRLFPNERVEPEIDDVLMHS
jgi:hypothetical protein